jgi:hypothetical protein
MMYLRTYAYVCKNVCIRVRACARPRVCVGYVCKYEHMCVRIDVYMYYVFAYVYDVCACMYVVWL